MRSKEKYYYVLYCQTIKAERVCNILKKNGFIAFIPKMEKYIGSKDIIVSDIVMFPGYVFVNTSLDKLEFNQILSSIHVKQNGVIRELKTEEYSALSDEEIELFEHLLDDEFVMRMSYGYREEKHTTVYRGPLTYYEDQIMKVDFKDCAAYLKIPFMKRNIRAGLIVSKTVSL